MSPHGRTAQTIIILLDLALLGHFALGFYLTVRLYVALGEWLALGWFIPPYVGLTAIFVLSGFLAVHHLRWAATTLILGVLLSACMCAYDLVNCRCRILGGGVGHVYTMWWWYYEPFWYGYTPGNV
jgi:hypothetical protein